MAINPSTIPGLKSGVCSGLILSGAFDPVLKAWVWRRRSIKKRRKRGFLMEKITHQELLKDNRMRFAISIINSAYASDSLDRLRIQRPGSARYYLPMELRYLAGAEGDPQHRGFGAGPTAPLPC